jgi:hypothetical protein
VVVVPSNRHHICQQMMIKFPSEEEIQAITEEKLAQFFYNTFKLLQVSWSPTVYSLLPSL